MKSELAPIIASDQIINTAIKLSKTSQKKMIAVAGAEDAAVIGALSSSNADGILDATLFGDKNKIEAIASRENINITQLDIINNTNSYRN